MPHRHVPFSPNVQLYIAGLGVESLPRLIAAARLPPAHLLPSQRGDIFEHLTAAYNASPRLCDTQGSAKGQTGYDRYARVSAKNAPRRAHIQIENYYQPLPLDKICWLDFCTLTLLLLDRWSGLTRRQTVVSYRQHSY